MVYTCSCCKYIEYRQLIGGGNYYCTLHKYYMYSGSRQCQHFELKDDLKNDPFYNNECNYEDNTTKVVESRRGKCLDYNFNLCDDCEMWTDSPCYRGEYCAMMNNDDVRKRLDEIVKNLMKSIIPKQINGRDLYGGYAVDMYAEYYVNVQFGIGLHRLVRILI